MHTKVFVFGLICLMQVCGPVLAETLAPEPADSPGMLQMLAKKAREAQEKVNELVGGVLMLASMYHDEYIQPLTSSYAQWASDVKSSAWEKIQTTLDEYMMIKATNATDQN
ncbi:apolipoprotein C-IV [Scophthalmus maximus]|uniref:apolipoprotein C-IV n=1 Tax=Scophthalmus maximus TaxID=52904 RepID=UPI0015E0C08C|nr:apolipoprotein C-IV [Scophthalmus maximus]